VRLWIEMFNRGGIDALASRPRSGRPRKIKIERVRDLLVPVLENPSQAGELHWTGVKLHGWIKEQASVELGYRTLIRYLHELNYNLRVPRPWPERQDQQQREAFIEQLRHWQQQNDLELWFADECGVEADPRRRRRWTARGSRPTVPYLGDHIRANVVGAVCPQSGENFTMIFDAMDTDCFQCFLDQLNANVPLPEGKRRMLIVDNASWHKAQRLNWGAFAPAFLPGYSPDLNPIERLWLRMKADFFCDFIARTPDELIDRLTVALVHYMERTDITAAQCRFWK
jgi:transposase